ncbi:Calmodulin (CaM) [Durusdinium trenchii]|uniref:Calmodulin (CaM) n=1 Tax=Durusdinium trenchii TaxID=1381693 RepID=A0ABP0JGK8_9DINO
MADVGGTNSFGPHVPSSFAWLGPAPSDARRQRMRGSNRKEEEEHGRFKWKSFQNFTQGTMWEQRKRLFEELDPGYGNAGRFQLIDGDHDGAVEKGEFLRLLPEDTALLISHKVETLLSDAQISAGTMVMTFDDVFDVMSLCRSTSNFTSSELEELKEAFHRFDEDSSGKIDVLEMVEMLLYMGYSSSLEVVHQIIHLSDADGNDELDFQEFLHVMSTHELTHTKALRSAFQKNAGLGGTTCSREEVSNLLQKLGYFPGEEELDGIFTSDANGVEDFDFNLTRVVTTSCRRHLAKALSKAVVRSLCTSRISAMGYGKDSSFCSTYGSYGKASASWAKPKTPSKITQAKSTCKNCGGRGHEAKDCPSAPLCKTCGLPNHTTEECWNASKKCNICGKTGHLMNVCRKKAQKEKNGWAEKGQKWGSKQGWTESSRKVSNVSTEQTRKVEWAGKRKETWSDKPKKQEWSDKRRKKEQPNPECYCCGSWWHEKNDCPYKDNKCDFCGKTGHLFVMCLDRKDCSRCGSADHSCLRCPMRIHRCELCGLKGHTENVCHSDRPSTWKLEKEKNKFCRRCGSWWHAQSVCPHRQSRCGKCGALGHLEEWCRTRGRRLRTKKKGEKDEEEEDREEIMEEEMDQMDAQELEEILEGCACCGNPEHEAKDCPLQDLTCELCGLRGHLENMCRSSQIPSTEKPGIKDGDRDAQSELSDPGPLSEEGDVKSEVSVEGPADELEQEGSELGVADGEEDPDWGPADGSEQEGSEPGVAGGEEGPADELEQEGSELGVADGEDEDGLLKDGLEELKAAAARMPRPERPQEPQWNWKTRSDQWKSSHSWHSGQRFQGWNTRQPWHRWGDRGYGRQSHTPPWR